MTTLTTEVQTETKTKAPVWKRALKAGFIVSSGAFIGFHAAMTVVLACAATAAHYGVMDKLDLLHPLFGT